MLFYIFVSKHKKVITKTMMLESKKRCMMYKGSIEVICGSMFSGKTEELLRRLKRANIAKLKVAAYKPDIDVRYNEKKIVSHNSNYIESIPVKNSADIIDLSIEAQVIGIDEVQFFKNDIVSVCNKLANRGKRVIVSGLDMDFNGEPFGAMPHILCVAEKVTKLHAICSDCGEMANNSFRTYKSNNLIHVGEKDKYKPLCRDCFYKI